MARPQARARRRRGGGGGRARVARALLGVAALAGAAAAAAGCGGASARRAAADRGGARPGASRPARAPPLPLPALRALVRSLARETAQIRGLAFRREVPVRVETPEQIARHLRAELEAERGELADEQRIGVALGVLPPGADMVALLARFVGAEAQGYYDPSEATLVLTTAEAAALRSAGPDGAEARATIVHELTHALQHQHFAGRVEQDDGAAARPPPLSDGARARLALLEGDATLVAMEWALRRRGGRLLGAADADARLRRWAEGAQVLTEQDVPSYLIDSAELPYEAGALAVAALYARGGWAGVNAAIADTTLRAAQVLHPERDPAGAGFVALPAPEGAGLLARGLRRTLVRTLGEVELRLYLGRVMRVERAAALAAAWRGDALALFEPTAGGAPAIVWAIACESEASAAAVASGLAPLADRWRREGCPGVHGAAAGRPCPASITHAGRVVTVARGE